MNTSADTDSATQGSGTCHGCDMKSRYRCDTNVQVSYLDKYNTCTVFPRQAQAIPLWWASPCCSSGTKSFVNRPLALAPHSPQLYPQCIDLRLVRALQVKPNGACWPLSVPWIITTSSTSLHDPPVSSKMAPFSGLMHSSAPPIPWSPYICILRQSALCRWVVC